MDDATVSSSTVRIDEAFDRLHGEFDLLLDACGTILEVRGAAPAVLGAAPVVGTALTEFVHPDDHSRLLEAFTTHTEAPTFELVVRWQHADGSWRSVECSTAPVGDGRVALVGHDVTAGLLAQAEVQAWDALLAVWHEGVPIGVAHDAVARLAEAAVPTARAAVYVRRGDDYELAAAPRLGGRWTRVGFRVPSEDFAGAVPGTAEAAPARLRELAADQGLGFAWTVAAPGTEPPTGVVVVFVGEKRFLHAGERAGLDRAAHVLARTLDSERRIDAEHQAVTSDPLSGVAARAATVAALGSAPVGASVMAVQVDGIDAINREHGVAVGDAVLAQVGRTLHEQTRQRDLVGRVGSRTFVVVSTGGRDDDGSANSWVERITASLRTPVLADGARLEPECRIAVTVVRRDQDGLGALDDVLGRLRGENLRSGLAGGDR